MPEETEIVRKIFELYIQGNGVRRIKCYLEQCGIKTATGKSEWSTSTIDRMLSDEKYTGRVLLQKTVSTGAVQIENDGLMDRYLYTDTHEAIISDEIFTAVQQEKLSRSKEPQNHVAMRTTF